MYASREGSGETVVFLYTCIDSTIALALNIVIMITKIGHIVFLVLIYLLQVLNSPNDKV